MLTGGVLGDAANFGATFDTSYVKICVGRFGTGCFFIGTARGHQQLVVGE